MPSIPLILNLLNRQTNPGSTEELELGITIARFTLNDPAQALEIKNKIITCLATAISEYYIDLQTIALQALSALSRVSKDAAQRIVEIVGIQKIIDIGFCPSSSICVLGLQLLGMIMY